MPEGLPPSRIPRAQSPTQIPRAHAVQIPRACILPTSEAAHKRPACTSEASAPFRWRVVFDRAQNIGPPPHYAPAGPDHAATFEFKPNVAPTKAPSGRLVWRKADTRPLFLVPVESALAAHCHSHLSSITSLMFDAPSSNVRTTSTTMSPASPTTSRKRELLPPVPK